MGEIQGRSGGGKFYKISGGQLALPAKEDTPGAVARTYEEDDGTKKTVYELLSDGWFGHIVALKRVTGGKYGDELHIGLQDENENAWIKTKLDSGYAIDFMKRLLSPQFSFGSPCVLTPHQIEEGKKKSYYFGITQNEVKIKSIFTKEYQENPANKFKLPDWERIDMGAGKVLWNKAKQIEFLWHYCNQKALKHDPMFKLIVEQNTAATSNVTAPVTPQVQSPVTPQYTNLPDYQQRRDAALPPQAPIAPQHQSPTPPVYQPPAPPAPPAQTGFGGAAFDDDLPF